jgi:hypothetical protein
MVEPETCQARSVMQKNNVCKLDFELLLAPPKSLGSLSLIYPFEGL